MSRKKVRLDLVFVHARRRRWQKQAFFFGKINEVLRKSPPSNPLFKGFDQKKFVVGKSSLGCVLAMLCREDQCRETLSAVCAGRSETRLSFGG